MGTNAAVLHLELKSSSDERDPVLALDEAVALTQAIDLPITHQEIVRISKRSAGYLLTKGHLERLGDFFKANEIDLVIINNPVSPIQQRNLEKKWDVKVLDRTALILEIFGARAQTREGVLQVDLAQLSYQKSRLVRSWTHLERQRGGLSFIGGSGETQIESDRRMIDEAIVRLKRQLVKVVKTRSLHRAARRRVPYPIVALVGYTNAGKSSIFNRLTGENVLEKDMLFATLDPTMRSIELPNGREIILSDTVGFISDLPTQLVASFRATLEEVIDADLILHVRDISHPETNRQAENVLKITEDLGVKLGVGTPVLEVWNKIDLLDGEDRIAVETRAARSEHVVACSATKEIGLGTLLDTVQEMLKGMVEEVILTIAYKDSEQQAWLHKENLVIHEDVGDEGYKITVRWTPIDRARYEKRYSISIG